MGKRKKQVVAVPIGQSEKIISMLRYVPLFCIECNKRCGCWFYLREDIEFLDPRRKRCIQHGGFRVNPAVPRDKFGNPLEPAHFYQRWHKKGRGPLPEYWTM